MELKEYTTTGISYIIKPEKRKLIRLSYALRNKIALEIGGPSSFFSLRSYFPVYVFANRVDGVNYSTETVWEGKIHEGRTYNYTNQKKGYQYILEATDLKKIKDCTYDFLLACHSLEHIANPIQALKEWYRVLKPGGTIVLVLPDKKHTFDHNRPYTTFEHLVQDFKSGVTEHDSTHFEEIFTLHDINMDTGINSDFELKTRTQNNYISRCVHHHVYSFELLDKVLTFCEFKLTYQQEVPPFHLVNIAKKQ